MPLALGLLDLLPFLGVLLSIAFLPLIAPRFWHRHYPAVAAAWALAFAVPFLLRSPGAAAHQLLEVALLEYLPFLAILFALFSVTGGIEIVGSLSGTPRGNLLVLLAGTLLASIIGTTGASMLLIRPLLRANAGRKRRAHVVVFFVFLVSNVGGSLTPLGDPPLFLGFLLGVPFFWTLTLLPHTLLLVGVLSGAFYLLDAWEWRQQGFHASPRPQGKLGLSGRPNVVLLGAVVLSVWLSGVWKPGNLDVLGVTLPIASLVRDVSLVLAGFLSLGITPAGLRERNGFGWGPMREVAILFAAIFTTLIAPTLLLRAAEPGPLAVLTRTVSTPDALYWTTGLLSSILDNAPTYLTMLHAQLGRLYPGLPPAEGVQLLLLENPGHLRALSAGAVFMGALTYIGNAPNFMVKAVAEEAGVAMPSFFGYVLRWSLPFLAPALALVAWLLV